MVNGLAIIYRQICQTQYTHYNGKTRDRERERLRDFSFVTTRQSRIYVYIYMCVCVRVLYYTRRCARVWRRRPPRKYNGDVFFFVCFVFVRLVHAPMQPIDSCDGRVRALSLSLSLPIRTNETVIHIACVYDAYRFDGAFTYRPYARNSLVDVFSWTTALLLSSS